MERAVPALALDAPASSAAVSQRFDSLIIFLVGALMVLGAVVVYSASVTLDGPPLDLARWHTSPLRQCIFAAAGFLAMLIAAHFDYRFWIIEKPSDLCWSGGLALLAAALLLLVFVPGIGVTRLGAQRSIVLMNSPISISFQPSEVAKLALVVWLAAWLSSGLQTRTWAASGAGLNLRPSASPRARSLAYGYLPALGSAGVLIGLTAIEDFGTAALMGVVTMVVLFLAGARWIHLIATGMLGLGAGAAFILAEPYRIQRLTTFLAENPDPQGAGYQILQARIAIASGGWWGRGLGAGIQKYDYLPQDNNDFVLAILCEELGVAGGIAVCLIFLLLLLRGWQISARATHPFGKLLAAGITLMICLQAAFNIGVVTDSIPTKGISLPFVSAGGSGVIVLGISAGLLASIGRGAAPDS